ncbi:hypothetical protein [Rhodococcus sp. JVH1]|uniref:hypothetical protein n=1 Tax=Rhodococcus sp. JVH1 TaxID=745408 RepID=UPI00027207EE|nr:hypothetical protein [Rhodococcus sp. JVH1]EJJ01019.1 hypothetical protein JVH1_1645 [Rhodococcus sp. JVH1]
MSTIEQSDALDVITCAIERSPWLSPRHIAEVVENDLVNARLLPAPEDQPFQSNARPMPSDQSTADGKGQATAIDNAQRHLDAWADTADGYRTLGRRHVLQCLWCDKYFGGRTKAEALARYRKHEDQLRAELEGGE